MIRKAIETVTDVSFATSIPVSKILGKGRSKSVVEARRWAIKAIRKETKMSLTEIAKLFDGRHHTTILHYLQT